MNPNPKHQPTDKSEHKIDSPDLLDFARALGPQTPLAAPSGKTAAPPRRGHINLDRGDVKNGLGQLVLTLVKLIHELLERQAIRRIDSGSLRDEEVERIGVTLMRQVEEIERLRVEFGLEEDDLNIDLGPLGTLF